MSSIPLVALMNTSTTHPVMPDNLLEDVAQAQQISASRQQMQQSAQEQPGRLAMQAAQLLGLQTQVQGQQQELQDEQKWRAAMADPNWDGTTQDLLAKGLKQGVGPKSYAMVSQGLAATGEAYAKLGTEQLKLQDALGNHIGDQFEAIQSAAPKDKLAAQQQAKQNAIAWANSTPGLNPAVKQNFLSELSKVPDDVYIGDDDLKTFVSHLKLHSTLVEEGLKTAQAAEAAGKGREADVNAQLGAIKLRMAQNSKPGDFDAQIDQLAPPGSPLNGQAKALVNGALSRGDLDGAKQALDQTFQRMGSMEQAQMAQQAENVRQALNRQAMQSNELQRNGLGQLDKMFTDPQHGYTQFLSQAQSTKNTIASAQNGDQLASSLAPLMTALGVTSFAGVHRINQTEVNAAGPQVGSIFRQVNAVLDKVGSGTIPADTTKEMGNLIDGLIDAKHASLIQGAQLVSRNNGLDPSKTTVMARDGSVDTLANVSKPAAPKSGPVDVKDPNGGIHRFPDQKSADAFKRAAGIQ